MRQPSDNSPLNWTNWEKNEPNNADGNEHWWVSSTPFLFPFLFMHSNHRMTNLKWNSPHDTQRPIYCLKFMKQ